VRIPLEGSGISNGARFRSLLDETAVVEARGGALEIELPANSAVVYR
jgi:hypothetical protein